MSHFLQEDNVNLNIDTSELLIANNQETQESTTPSTRRRKAPKRLIDISPSTGAHSKRLKQKHQPLRGNWSIHHLLTNAKSAFTNVNLNVSLIGL